MSWHYLGVCHEEGGRFADAMEAYAKATAIHPYPPSLNRSGIVAAKQQRYPEALAFFTHAERIAPDNTDYRFNVAMALKLLGRMDEAVAILKKFPPKIALGPEMLVVQEEKPKC